MAMEPPTSIAAARGDAKQQMPPKFSRYRSVRKAAANRQMHEPPPPPPPPAANPNPAIARSMSRYRRNKPNPLTQHSQPMPPLPTQTIPQNDKGIEVDEYEGAHAQQSGGRSGKASRNISVHSGNNNAPHDPPMEARILDMAISSPTKVNGDYKESARRDYGSGAEQCGFYSDEEPEEVARRNRKLKMGQRSREHISTNASKGRRAGYGHKEAQDTVPEIPENHRGEEGRANQSAVESLVQSQASKPVTLKERLAQVSRGRSDREHLKKMISSPKLLDQEDDAQTKTEPAPAPVDPGARKALIQYNGFSIGMSVNAATTPKEVLSYAAEHLSDDVDPNTSFLMESFSQLELERPVRMYENVLDILNSWDSDIQNFLVVSLTRDGGPQSIHPGGAPLERPEESSFHLYHSSRPGKWNKRWVTLRTDGQVVVSKKLGIEQSNICHLSDYDIYTPSPYQMSKRIKPPKKICFAMKSQQKSNLFLNTENFVHYFCSNDATTIDALYKAVQEWRSWYLGYTLGKIQTESKPVSRVDRLSKSSKHSTPRSSVHQRSVSGESTSNQPAGFRPLINRSEPNSRRNSQRSSSIEPGNQNGSSSRRTSKRGRGPPPTSRHASRLSDDPDGSSVSNSGALVKGMSPEEVEEATFAPTGLLGRTYSQRQKAQREREQGLKDDFDGPFSPTGLINNPGKAAPGSATQSKKNSLDLPSGGQQPLVDLTPVYQEPIHHNRRGRGVKVEPGQQLVGAATGRELRPGAIVVPSSTTVNRPRQGTLIESQPPTRDFTSFNPSNGGGNGNLSRSNTTRTVSRRQNPNPNPSLPRDSELASPPLPTTRPSSPEGPFSPTGLLARSGTMARAQGAAPGGRGVVTGDRKATSRPLLDLSETSEFANGSLLQRVEKWDDGNVNGRASGNANIPEPIIDRERD